MDKFLVCSKIAFNVLRSVIKIAIAYIKNKTSLKKYNNSQN